VASELARDIAGIAAEVEGDREGARDVIEAVEQARRHLIAQVVVLARVGPRCSSIAMRNLGLCVG
jgi:hypothetical protein